MGVEELKQALDDCIINFDSQVLVTNLLQDYQTSYANVDNILKKHLAAEEKKGTKFRKRFLVSGEEETTSNEIYTVVNDEAQVNEWLKKLKNAESALYSVEVAGGAKPAADIFVPMRWCPRQLDNIKTRAPLKSLAATTDNSGESVKTEIKSEAKKPKGFDFSANAKKQTTESSSKPGILKKDVKKSPPSVEKPKTPKKSNTPEAKESPTATKGNAKKGIANFFNSAKTEDKSKKETRVAKPPTPKKMQDFFKKSEKTATAPKIEQQKKADESMQLFDDEDGDDDVSNASKTSPAVEEVNSTDDEAELEALRRKCSEQKELDEATSSSAAKKRRRIIDSDDEEDGEAPQVKHEKKDAETKTENNLEESEEAVGKSETFLDDDGFVITIKGKKPAVSKKPTKATSPKKSPPIVDKKPTKSTPKPASKTKQGNIMSFFPKK